MNKLLKNLLLFSLAAVALASCSMMETDRSECPDGLYVRFVYDYNIQRADMFKDHVGGVTLYVFDESDRMVAQREVANEGDYVPLRSYEFTMHFTPDELPAGRYRLVAVAQQKGYAATLATPGAKFRRSDMAKGSPRTDLEVRLDRQTVNADGICPVSHTAALDTLWMGTVINPARPDDGQAELVEVKAQVPTYATVYMVRDTKNLSLTLRQLDDPMNMQAEDYELTIMDRNGRLGHDNSVLPDDLLLYAPYDRRTLESADGTYRTAHFDINCSRLIYHADNPAQNARLRIHNKNTNTDVLVADLAAWLERLRNYMEYRYSAQEFLDRQYDYRIEVLLRGGTWQEISVSCQVNVLSWTYRIQNVEL